MKKNVVLATFEGGFRGISIRYLSSWVKQLGYTCKLLFTCRRLGNYQNMKQFTDDEVTSVIKFLKDNSTDILGLSIMTGDFLASAELVKLVKKELPSIQIIYGGIHSSLMPDECMQSSADFAVVGDGEIPLKEILEEQPVESISGIAYKSNGKIYINPPRREDTLSPDLLPFPDYQFSDHYYINKGTVEKLDQDTYKRRTAWGGNYYYLTTSRGCPFRCAYCCNYNRMQPRRNSVERVIEELHYIKNIMPFIKGVNIQDDSFYMGSDEYLERFCEKLAMEFGWPFIARLMPKYTNDKRIKMLKAGGLEHVSIGLQGSERLNRDFYQRLQSNQSIIDSCSILKKYGINYVVDVLLDNPYETEDDLREIAATLNTIPKPFTVIAYGLTLFPGTTLYERVKKDGRVEEFGTDPYRSMFKATRPNAYRTPIQWRKLIQFVVAQAPKKHVENILIEGPTSLKGAQIIDGLERRYKSRIRFGNTIKNLNPRLFRIVLKFYQKIVALRDSIKRK